MKWKDVKKTIEDKGVTDEANITFIDFYPDDGAQINRTESDVDIT